eukprot:CAMPEP_0174830650 /NCGR_PEP_ID=MMETSP1114-20130205/2639_1 /TAXON_ID=312471 /ORGANISM="Neobodo designis, Strain CCAP 1951/1" /LENGTH=928 /DNA_ID=CAMNT_0016064453 /DNA_START=61 /DNA_END=2843 /DNA_ORIENTATION=+
MSQQLRLASPSTSHEVAPLDRTAGELRQLRQGHQNQENTIRHMVADGTVQRAGKYLTREHDQQVELQRNALEIMCRIAEGCEKYTVHFPSGGVDVAEVARHLVRFHAEARKHAVTVLHTVVVLDGTDASKVTKFKEVLGDASSGVAAALTTFGKTGASDAVIAVELLHFGGHWAGDSDAVAQIVPLLKRALLQTPGHVSAALRLVHAVVDNRAVGTAEFKAVVDTLVNNDAVPAVVAAVKTHPDDPYVAHPAWRILATLRKSPEHKHLVTDNMYAALRELALPEGRYAFASRQLSEFDASKRSEEDRRALLKAVIEPMSAGVTCAHMLDNAKTAADIPRIVDHTGALPLAAEHLGVDCDGRPGSQCDMLRLVAKLAAGYGAEGNSLPEAFIDAELVNNVARLVKPNNAKDPVALAAVTALYNIVQFSSREAFGAKFQESLFGPDSRVVPALVHFATSTETQLPTAMQVAKLLDIAWHWNWTRDFGAVAPIIPLLSGAVEHVNHVYAALRLLREFASKSDVPNIVIDALIDGGAIRALLLALTKHPDNRAVADGAWAVLAKVLASPSKAHTRHIVGQSDLLASDGGSSPDNIATLAPVLKRALRGPHVVQSLQMLRCFADGTAADTSAATAATIDRIVDSGIVRDVVARLAASSSSFVELEYAVTHHAWSFLISVCKSPHAAHQRHVVFDTGLLESLPTLVAAGGPAYFATTVPRHLAGGDGETLRQYIAALLRAVSKPTQVSLACAGMRDAVDADPSTGPHIVAAGAVPFAAKHLAEAHAGHKGLHCNALQLVAALADGFQPRGQPSPFMNAELIANVARHVERNADPKILRCAVTALQRVAFTDTAAFSATFKDSLHFLVPALERLVDVGDTPLATAMPAAALLRVLRPEADVTRRLADAERALKEMAAMPSTAPASEAPSRARTPP